MWGNMYCWGGGGTHLFKTTFFYLALSSTYGNSFILYNFWQIKISWEFFPPGEDHGNIEHLAQLHTAPPESTFHSEKEVNKNPNQPKLDLSMILTTFLLVTFEFKLPITQCTEIDVKLMFSCWSPLPLAIDQRVILCFCHNLVLLWFMEFCVQLLKFLVLVSKKGQIEHKWTVDGILRGQSNNSLLQIWGAFLWSSP